MTAPARSATRAVLLLALVLPGAARGQSASAAPWLDDRRPGVRTSIFGTYVRPGELLVSPFFELYIDDNLEYSPAELVGGVDQDFRGRYRASEGLLFLAWGFSDRLALEVEVAAIRARLDKSPDDPSAVPARLEESGWGDRQAQLDWRIAHESGRGVRLPARKLIRPVDPPSGDRVCKSVLMRNLDDHSCASRIHLTG